MNTLDNRWIGQRTIRPDGADKVTGSAAYGADYTLPGMLWGKIMRSPHAHARIVSIDTSKAEALPGVKAVITAKDLVEFPLDKPVHIRAYDLRWLSRLFMAREKVLFAGHPIAAVAANTAAIAAEACALIDVTYEVLPFSIEIDDAMKPDAPLVHGDFFKVDGKPSNIAGKIEFKKGDIEEGFKKAEIVLERTYTMPAVHQGYIEPHACTVSVGSDGKTTIYSSSQGHFLVRAAAAAITGLPQSDIRAVAAEIGGGFGGKLVPYLEPLATALSRKAGRPVKMVMTRDDVMRATGPAAASKARVKVGATRDGKIVAVESEIYLQSGAFPGGPIRGATGSPFGCYEIPHLHAVGYEVLSNRAKVAAYRAPGGPQGQFGAECILDELAHELEIDPLELRMINAAQKGTLSPHGVVFPNIGFVDVLNTAKAHPHYNAPLDKLQGRGFAGAFWWNNNGQSSAQVNVTEDGNVVVTTGHPDIGGSRASIANITAELFGIEHSRVSVLIGDTSSVGYSDMTAGSKTLLVSSKAVTESTEKVISILCERAAAIWKIDPEAVTWRDGAAHPAGDNAGSFKPLTLADIGQTVVHGAAPIGASAQLVFKGHESAFCAHICDVEVDIELGTVKVIRYTAVHDVGRAIHPSYVEGQIHGGIAQSLGWALNEEYLYTKDGKVDNATFLDYRMPVCSDLPMLDAVLLEIPNPNHPQGVKGIGEAPIVPPVPAVVNAVSNALRKRFYDLPLKPSRVLEKIMES